MATSTDEWLAKISGQLDTLLGGGAPTAPPHGEHDPSPEGQKDATPQVSPGEQDPPRKARKRTTSTTVRGD